MIAISYWDSEHNSDCVKYIFALLIRSYETRPETNSDISNNLPRVAYDLQIAMIHKKSNMSWNTPLKSFILELNKQITRS